MTEHRHAWRTTAVEPGPAQGTTDISYKCDKCGATTGVTATVDERVEDETARGVSTTRHFQPHSWHESSDSKVNALQERAGRVAGGPEIQKHIDDLHDAYRDYLRQKTT